MIFSILFSLLTSRMPPLAWVAIAVIVILFLVTNIILVALLVAKNRSPKSLRRAQLHGSMESSKRWAKFGEVMRDPLAKERNQLNELSQLVQNLDKSKVDPPNTADTQHKDS